MQLSLAPCIGNSGFYVYMYYLMVYPGYHEAEERCPGIKDTLLPSRSNSVHIERPDKQTRLHTRGHLDIRIKEMGKTSAKHGTRGAYAGEAIKSERKDVCR